MRATLAMSGQILLTAGSMGPVLPTLEQDVQNLLGAVDVVRGAFACVSIWVGR
jgi:hypothetical protein